MRKSSSAALLPTSTMPALPRIMSKDARAPQPPGPTPGWQHGGVHTDAMLMTIGDIAYHRVGDHDSRRSAAAAWRGWDGVRHVEVGVQDADVRRSRRPSSSRSPAWSGCSSC